MPGTAGSRNARERDKAKASGVGNRYDEDVGMMDAYYVGFSMSRLDSSAFSASPSIADHPRLRVVSRRPAGGGQTVSGGST